jgi:signal transduction histidine kinase
MPAFPLLLTTRRVGHVYLDARHRRLRFLNRTAKQLHHDGVPLTPSELAAGGLQTPDGRGATAADLPLYVALRDGRPVEAQFVLTRPGGTVWHLDWSASPLWRTATQLDGVLGTVTCGPPEPDAQRLAELAHDLRTPLQTLRLQCALLEQLAPSEGELATGLEVGRSAAERAVQIALELLDCCRGPVSRSSAAALRWFPLEPFLHALAEEQAVMARAKGLTLRVDLAAACGWAARSDPLRLGRVLANLLGNAVRYTPRGGVALRAAWRDEVAQRVLVISVIDTGPGIAEDEQEVIFHPYERGRAGQEPDSGGSGLGLAIVDRLVEELGLRVEVESRPGRGSTFHLLLPAPLLRSVAQ